MSVIKHISNLIYLLTRTDILLNHFHVANALGGNMFVENRRKKTRQLFAGTPLAWTNMVQAEPLCVRKACPPPPSLLLTWYTPCDHSNALCDFPALLPPDIFNSNRTRNGSTECSSLPLQASELISFYQIQQIGFDSPWPCHHCILFRTLFP